MWSFYWAKFMKKIRGKTIKNSYISKTSKIGAGSWIINTSIQRYSYCGYDCSFFDTNIGSFCSIANNVSIGISNHSIYSVSTSPIFIFGKNVLGMNFAKHESNHPKTTVIENDVWIGAGSYIKSGVTISTGAIIGMGSVVTKNVGPYEIWGGNPAKLIRKRFDDEQIEQLLKSEWWLKKDEDLKKMAYHFNDVNSFLEFRKINQNENLE